MYPDNYYGDFIHSMLNHTFGIRHQPTVYVVSEERIKELEEKRQQRTLSSIDERIEELQAYRKSVEDSIPDLEPKE
jgi:hypothetical protein